MTTAIISSTNQDHHERGKKARATAGTIFQIMLLVALAFGIAEVFVYHPVLQAENWAANPIFNDVMCFVLSAIPVGLACLLALSLAGLRKQKRNPMFYVAIAVLLAMEIAFFVVVWHLRSSGASSKLLSTTLNIVGIIICIIAFGLHLWLSKKRDLLLIKARIHDGRERHNNNQRELAPLKQTSSIDYQRRLHDFRSWLTQFCQLPETCLLNLNLSRQCCAEHKAKTDEEMLFAVKLPYHFNNQTYASGEEAQRAIAEYLHMPTEAEFHTVYGRESNPTLDKRASESLESFQERYNAINAMHKGVEE